MEWFIKTNSCDIKFTIKLDDLSGKEVHALLQQHLEDMKSTSPPESKHALNLDGLKDASVLFWTIWDESCLAGCGALKKINDDFVEIKSMRTSNEYKNQGVGSLLLTYIIGQAKKSSYKKIYLETGSMEFFYPAHALYKKHGFKFCGPFAQYMEDPNSNFMSLSLSK